MAITPKGKMRVTLRDKVFLPSLSRFPCFGSDPDTELAGYVLAATVPRGVNGPNRGRLPRPPALAGSASSGAGAVPITLS